MRKLVGMLVWNSHSSFSSTMSYLPKTGMLPRSTMASCKVYDWTVIELHSDLACPLVYDRLAPPGEFWLFGTYGVLETFAVYQESSKSFKHSSCPLLPLTVTLKEACCCQDRASDSIPFTRSFGYSCIRPARPYHRGAGHRPYSCSLPYA